MKGSKIFDNLITAGDIFCFLNLIADPAFITGLGHDWGRSSTLCSDRLDKAGIAGSLTNIAIAGKVLGTTKVSGRLEENTDITTAPLSPATRVDNSVATKAF